jgi:deazaflavin-dependent oxidoreductase (nitroreductase family)
MEDPFAGAIECRLTTTGRTSGEPRTITIWFARADGRLWLLSGGGTDAHWVRNLMADPRVVVEAAGVRVSGTARVVAPGEPADGIAREAMAAKYGTKYLTTWLRTSLPVEITPDETSRS